MVRLYRTFSNLIFTVGTRCVGYLYTRWLNPLEPPRNFSNHFSAEKERCVEVFDVKFGVVRLYRTFSNLIFTVVTRCVGYLYTVSEKVRTSSNLLEFSALKWFEGVEQLVNSVQVPYTSCSHCVDEVREGSVQSNHSELTSKTSTHLSFSALKWFEKVRGGSRGLNHSETVYTYPTHLVTTVYMRFEG